MFNDFQPFSIRTETPSGGATIRGRKGGSGYPILLLHGYPQTGAMWHRVAPELAKRFTVVIPDLRGYGQSSKPETDEHHAPYSKREMALDMLQVMATMGYGRFHIGAHDRGARVAHRLALDHPDAVRAMAFLDVAPTREMYRATDEAFARAYWHWFWLTLPAPAPERMIGADPRGFWRLKCGSCWSNGSPGVDLFDAEALSEYFRCWTPETIHATCEDYRAAASIDITHDDADGGRRVEAPLLALWGSRGAIPRSFDCMSLWKQRAMNVAGYAIEGGHYLAEECSDAVLSAFLKHFEDPKHV